MPIHLDAPSDANESICVVGRQHLHQWVKVSYGLERIINQDDRKYRRNESGVRPTNSDALRAE